MMLHTVIEGSTVSVESDSDLSLSPTSFARWTIDRNTFEFGSGKREFADSFARGLGLKAYASDLSFGGGRLRVGSDVILDETTRWSAPRSWAVWEGNTYSFFTQRINVSQRELVDVVARFDVTESETGVFLTPVQGDALPAPASGLPSLYKGISNIGLMSIWARGNAPTIPSWGGRRVRGGELYRGSSTPIDDGQIQHSLVLVGNSAVALLDVNVDADEEAAVDRMANMVARWDVRG